MDERDITFQDLCKNAGDFAGVVMNAQTDRAKTLIAAAMKNGGQLEVRVMLGKPCVARALLHNHAGECAELGSTVESITPGH